MLAFTELTPEAPPITDVRPPADWPTYGEIVLNKMSLIYPSTTEPVLKGTCADETTNDGVMRCVADLLGRRLLHIRLVRAYVDDSVGRKGRHRGAHGCGQELSYRDALPPR